MIGIMHCQPIAVQSASIRLNSLEQAIICVNFLRVLPCEGFDVRVSGVDEVLRHLFANAGDLG